MKNNPIPFGNGGSIKINSEYNTDMVFTNDKIPNIGETMTLIKNPNMRWGAILTYSEDESQTQTNSLNTMFTLAKIIGTKAKKRAGIKYFDSIVMTPNYLDAIYFLANPK